MEKKTVGILATIVAILLCGVSGLFIALAMGIPAQLVSYLPAMQGSTLSIAAASNAPNFGLFGDLGSCCLCIPIPLVLGLFALSRKANVALVKEHVSQHPSAV